MAGPPDLRVRTRLRLLLVLVPLALLATTIGACWTLAAHDADRRAQARSSRERAALSAVRDVTATLLARQADLAETVGQLHDPIAGRWRPLAHGLFAQPEVLSVTFDRRLLDADRAAWERAHGVRLFRSLPDGTRRPAPRRSDYLVVDRIVSRTRAGIGLDLGGNPLRRGLLTRAMLLGRTVASPPTHLLGLRQTAVGPVAWTPVRPRFAGGPDGWVGVVYESSRLLRAIQARAPRGVTLAIADGGRTVAGKALPADGIRTRTPFADRTWTVAARAVAPVASASPWIALGLGLGLTGAVCLLLFQNARRERYALELVAEKLREQYRVEVELRASEERHRTLLEQLEEGVVLLDPELTIVTSNGAAQRILGRSANDLQGRRWTDFRAIRADGRAWTVAERPATQTLRTGEPRLDQVLGITATDGTLRWLSANVRPLRHQGEDAPYAVVCSFVDATESRARRHELERQRAELADAQRIAGTGSWSADRDAAPVWSEELRRILGVRSEDEPDGVEGYLALVHDEDREQVSRELHAAFDVGRARDSDHRVIRPDGREIHVHARVRAELGSGGRVVRVYGTTQDVTDRVAAQRALRDSEERFRRVAAAAPVAIFEADAAGSLTWVNEEWCELTGMTKLDALGEGWLEAIPAEERDATLRGWRSGVAAGEDFPLDYRYRSPRGALVHMTGSAAVLRDARGEVTGWIGTALDVTAAHEAEERRRGAEEKFRSAFERAPIGMALTSLEGRFMQVNPALAELLGLPRELLCGMRVADLTHPDDAERDREAMEAMIRDEKESHETEKRYLHADGHAVRVALQTTLVRDGQGRPDHFLSQMQDVTERRSYEERLQFMADHDPLTGLLNRRSFERELDRHVASVRRYGDRGAVVVLDLDHFKIVNDSLGHAAGDKLIVEIAQRLSSRLRESDVVARLGGDEFAVLLPTAAPDEAVHVAQELLEVIRGEAVPVAGRPRRATASVGVAPVEHREGLTGEDLLVSADLAMYDAKEGGRDGVARYAAGPHERERTEARLSWVERIRDALDHDEFELHAQPIVDLGTGVISQWELLIRMRSADGDLIPPGAFLSVAERYGLIQDLDQWVLRRAIGLLARAREAGQPLTLEVNVSGRSMGDPRVLETVEHELAATGARAEDLILEITETAAVANIPQAQAFGRRLSELGCRFALDDFGAGFGSFHYLKHLPFDVLKIDGEFIRNCRANRVDRLVIGAVVDIARGLGKLTVAEFVGDDETMSLLRAHGVDYAQGFHLGKPAPLLDQLPALAP